MILLHDLHRRWPQEGFQEGLRRASQEVFPSDYRILEEGFPGGDYRKASGWLQEGFPGSGLRRASQEEASQESFSQVAPGKGPGSGLRKASQEVASGGFPKWPQEGFPGKSFPKWLQEGFLGSGVRRASQEEASGRLPGGLLRKWPQEGFPESFSQVAPRGLLRKWL
jgi:hypothetical protein